MKSMLRALPLLFLAAAACAPATTQHGTRSTATATRRPLGEAVERRKATPARTTRRASRLVRVSPEAVAGDVLREANRARRRTGAPRLRTDARLNQAARRYARELASRQEIEHVSRTPGLRTFRDRIEAAGAKARVAGENLARMTASASTLPDRVVDAWLRSPGHRSNLLERSFTRTGIGVWLGDDGVWYVVQIYATRS